MGEEVKHKYLFPNLVAKGMEKLTTQVQMEASMMSLVVILIGLIVGSTYTIFFVGGVNLFGKILIAVNSAAGFVFLSSFLVTSFQQYQSYMMAREIQFAMGGHK